MAFFFTVCVCVCVCKCCRPPSNPRHERDKKRDFWKSIKKKELVTLSPFLLLLLLLLLLFLVCASVCVNDVSVYTMGTRTELGWNENSFIFAEETERGQNCFIKCEWESEKERKSWLARRKSMDKLRRVPRSLATRFQCATAGRREEKRGEERERNLSNHSCQRRGPL